MREGGAEMEATMQAIGKSQVKLLPGLFKERMQVNRDYLLELDTQCLLQNFSLEAGIILPGLQVVDDPAAAKLHWGWEAPICQLRGHFLGHWLSAAAAPMWHPKRMRSFPIWRTVRA